MPYDLYIEGISDVTLANGPRVLTFGNYPRHIGIQGIYKLVVRFIKCFLTPRGSDPADPDYGTSLMASFPGNVDPKTIQALVSQSVQEALDKLREYDIEYLLPDEERLFSVEIEDLVADTINGNVTLKLNLKNVAGTVALFSVPVAEGANNG